MSYLKTLYGNDAAGCLAVWHKSNSQTRWFSASEPEEVEAYMQKFSASDDCYFGWGLQQVKLSSNKRGASESVNAVPGIMMDIDLKSDLPGVHANDNLPSSVQEAMSLIEEVGFLQPTQVRHSGNGIYADWLYQKLWYFNSEEERKLAADLSRRLQAGLIAAGQQLRGWRLDTTSDLARVTRMPGTKNHKTNPPKDVTMLNIGCEQRYSIEEIEAAVVPLEARFMSAEATVNRKTSKSALLRSNTFIAANENKPRLESVVAGCAWAAQVVENAERMPEPDWYALAGIAGRCDGGGALFHEISKEDSRYEVVETQQKLDHALEAAGPRTCANISEGHSDCQNCPFNGKITSPIQLGYLTEVQARLMRNYVFDVAAQAYIDKATGFYYDEKQFNSKFRHETDKSTPHMLLNGHAFTQKVDRSCYVPGNRGYFLRHEGENIFNTWRPCGAEPKPGGDTSIILGHAEYLFPETGERDHFLNCLASLVQKPNEKIKHVLLIIGRQGTGKSFWAELFKLMVGRKNIKTATSDDLNAEWTENVLDCQVLILEEVMTTGRKEVYNRMKQWVTDDTASANQKSKRIREAATPRLVVGFSNHAVPVSLEAGDRRFCVLRSDADPREPAYYEQLFSKGLPQAGAFVDYLSKRDISRFKPSAPPPMTDAKKEIIADARPRAEQVLWDLIETEDPALAKDVVAVSRIRSLVQGGVYGGQVSNNQLTEALRAIGGFSLDQVRLRSGQRERLWAIRNTEKWKRASNEELRAYLEEGM